MEVPRGGWVTEKEGCERWDVPDGLQGCADRQGHQPHAVLSA